MVKQADVSPGERVLEIGPGLGILTERLLARSPDLVAIEKDTILAKYIESKYSIEVINDDVLKVGLPEFDKVVSNLPYQISSAVTMKLLDNTFSKALLMFQKEFADHLVAEAGTGSYSRISVMCQYRADCSIVKNVSKGSFYPVPKVDSAIVELVPRPPNPAAESEEEFGRFMSILFSHKNRKVRNCLVSERKRLDLDKDGARQLADQLPHANERPVKLAIHELVEITNKFIELRED
jgi:16S rRNA (adenine1518-N6/adenine1519-N6)-dimethyltransferase